MLLVAGSSTRYSSLLSRSGDLKLCLKRAKARSVKARSLFREGGAKMAAALSSLPLLQTLDLGHKQLGAKGGARVAAALPSLPLLQALDLGSNELGAEMKDGKKQDKSEKRG